MKTYKFSKRYTATSYLMFFALLCTSCLSHFNTIDKPEDYTAKQVVYQNDAQKKQVESLLAKLTLEEKVGQMTQVTLDVLGKGNNVRSSFEPLRLDTAQLNKAFNIYKVGSVLNTANNRARDRETWKRLITEIQVYAIEAMGIPVLYGVDAIHGTTYTKGATFFPQQIGMAATWNVDLIEKGAAVTAYETRASSIPWTFSPVLDVARKPEWPRFWETFGEDSYLTGRMGAAVINGYEGGDNDVSNPYKVASCIKHFPAYGAEHSGKDRTPTWMPEIQLREYYLPSYQAAIDAGAKTIMINSGIINGIPVHANYELLTKLLRHEMGFEGMIVTDWADIENIYKRDKAAESLKEAVKLSINAGIDMSMVPYKFDFCELLVELVNEGEVPMSRIDDAVRRILRLKVELGLFEHPVAPLDTYPEFGSKKHEQLAYETATESITLLKNEEGILPLSKDLKVLVTGPNANSMRTLNGGWSYSWQGEKVEAFASEYFTIYEALKAKLGADQVVFEAGVNYDHKGKYWKEKSIQIEKAVNASSEVDVIVLCLGENTYTEKPGDLDDLYISKNQENLALALAKTGKPVILVLNEGRPRLIRNFVGKMKAVMHTYLPGNFGGLALVDLLLGEINPSGKLPFTYPMFPNSLTTYDLKPSEAQEKMEGVYDYASDVKVQYPFGYGLSYTKFKYSDLKVSSTTLKPNTEIEISVKITNIGDRAGKEVVQLYSKDYYASITPDNKRLRGFEKVDLKPNESTVVNFKINTNQLAFIGADNRYTLEKGDYALMIGDQSVDVYMSESTNK